MQDVPVPETPGTGRLVTAGVSGGRLGQDGQQRTRSLISHLSFLGQPQWFFYLLTFQIYDPKYLKGLDYSHMCPESSSS